MKCKAEKYEIQKFSNAIVWQSNAAAVEAVTLIKSPYIINILNLILAYSLQQTLFSRYS